MRAVTVFILCLVLAGCKKSEEPPAHSGHPDRIVDMVARDTTLSMFYEACKLNGLDTLLSSKSYYTVLAPHNFGFRYMKIFQKDIIKSDAMRNLMLYHFIPGKVRKVSNTLAINKNGLPFSIGYSYPGRFNGEFYTAFYNVNASNGMLITLHAPLRLPSLLDLLFKFHDVLENKFPMPVTGESKVFNLLWDMNSNVTFLSPTFIRYPSNLTKEEYLDVLHCHCIANHIARNQFYDGQVLQTLNPNVTLKVVKKDGVIKLTADNIHFSTLLKNDIRALNGIAYNMDSSIVK